MSLQQVSQVGKLLFDKVDFNPVLNVIQNFSGMVWCQHPNSLFQCWKVVKFKLVLGESVLSLSLS